MIDLNKANPPSSLRGMGTLASGLPPSDTIVGGLSFADIATHSCGCAYRVGKVSPNQAFCIEAKGGYYLYVHYSYSGYRPLAQKLFGAHPSFDIDHVLARNLAGRISLPYTLLALVPRKVNRSHGAVEKLGVSHHGTTSSQVAFLDQRMFHEVLGRRPYARQSRSELVHGYAPDGRVDFDLTLKQKGHWSIAFHLHSRPPHRFLNSLRPLH
jgi:hypothetical protein